MDVQTSRVGVCLQGTFIQGYAHRLVFQVGEEALFTKLASDT